MTVWDFIRQQYANLGVFVLANWIPLMSVAILITAVGWMLSELHGAPYEPEPLYMPLYSEVDDAAELEQDAGISHFDNPS
jgi:hypothetical protein